MKNTLKNNLPNNIVTKSAYSASKLSNKFDIKSKVKKDHQHDITYYVKCSEETCREDYTGETGRRLSERVIDHNGRDKKSHVLKHCKSHLLILPYAGQKGQNLIKSMKNTLKNNLPNNIVTKSAYSASKLSNKFDIKSKVKKDHQHDITYYVKCSEETCREDYTGETGRRLSERVIDHNGRDKKSHV